MSLNVPLAKSTVDAITNPEPHSPPAGDWHDDDGQALQSYFLHADPKDVISTLVRSVVNELKTPKCNRIIRRLIKFDDVATATYPYPARMILPPDPNRDSLTFMSSSVANNQSIFWSGDRFDALADAGTIPETDGALIPVPARTLVVPNYTGPVWAAPTGVGTGSALCIWWVVAVTQ